MKWTTCRERFARALVLWGGGLLLYASNPSVLVGSGADSLPITVVYEATGGTISSPGLYTTGTVAGAFRVTAQGAGLQATSEVTLTTPGKAPSWIDWKWPGSSFPAWCRLTAPCDALMVRAWRAVKKVTRPSKRIGFDDSLRELGGQFGLPGLAAGLVLVMLLGVAGVTILRRGRRPSASGPFI
jgi:hypothetical protein